MARLGIFGGTFDPVHIGHLILAAEALDQLNLDRLLWVLTPEPPHKHNQTITPLHIRYELLNAAIGDNPAFELSRVDMDRLGPHFAVETVVILRDLHPGDEMAYLIGGDSLHDLPAWKNPLELLRIIEILGVLRRPQDQVDLQALEAQLPGLERKIRFIEAPLLDIASSDIRKRAQESRPYRYFLPGAVYEIIHQRGLYQDR